MQRGQADAKGVVSRMARSGCVTRCLVVRKDTGPEPVPTLGPRSPICKTRCQRRYAGSAQKQIQLRREDIFGTHPRDGVGRRRDLRWLFSVVDRFGSGPDERCHLSVRRRDAGTGVASHHQPVHRGGIVQGVGGRGQEEGVWKAQCACGSGGGLSGSSSYAPPLYQRGGGGVLAISNTNSSSPLALHAYGGQLYKQWR